MNRRIYSAKMVFIKNYGKVFPDSQLQIIQFRLEFGNVFKPRIFLNDGNFFFFFLFNKNYVFGIIQPAMH